MGVRASQNRRGGATVARRAAASSVLLVAGFALAGGGAFSLAPTPSSARPASRVVSLGSALAPRAAWPKRSSVGGLPSPRRAIPEGAEAARQAHDWWQALGAPAGNPEEVAALVQQWFEAHNIPSSAFELWPPAWADDAATATAAAAPEIELDPNTKYIYGPDGNVLIDPYGDKPIVDDWWNGGFVGIQADIIKAIDANLREFGVPQAFGWSIVLYTLLIKFVTFPLTQGQLRSTSMMQLLAPKVKELQEKYKDDPETMTRLLGQLYTVMDVNPLGGCVPVLIQLPIFWSLYSVWRRLYAERFEFYSERWLWVPSLSQPNPDFKFRLDWLFDYTNGAPTMGWEDYLSYLIFPVILVGTSLIQQLQAQAARPDTGKDDTNLVLQVLPWISVYFIGTLSLELPAAVSVYYCTNIGLGLLQTQFVKWGLRQEIPGYAEFEKTGKFPEGAFEEMVNANELKKPAPKTLHEAALRNDEGALTDLLEGEAGFDINAWDEKQITPIGYATACGHLSMVKLLISKGANLQGEDGQKNSLLHYAAGYGQLEVLKEIVRMGADLWPANEWKDWRNKKGQSVFDAARVNKKGKVMDYLIEILGDDAPPMPAAPQLPAAEGTAEAAPGKVAEDEAAARARAAMLAAAEKAPAAAAAVSVLNDEPAPTQDTANALRAQVAKLKENPEAVEQARKMMGSVPPELLSMLSGGKMSKEEAKKAMDAVKDMKTEDLLARVDEVEEKVAKLSSAPAPEPVEKRAAPARVVD